MTGIATQADVLAIERQEEQYRLPASTYELIRRGTALNPQAPALSFFLRAEDHGSPETWTYQELLHQIHQTANLFDTLGASGNTVIAYILPNLPETHFVIWGGQAVGIVCAINPLLEPAAMTELLNAAGVSILVTLAPFPGTDLWPKVKQAIQGISTLRHLVLVNLADRVRGPRRLLAGLLQKREILRLHGRAGIRSAVAANTQIHDFGRVISRQPKTYLRRIRQIQPDDVSSYFCTGGTTGTPKLAVRRHHNEVANAWSAGQFLGDGVGPGKNIFCGLPLFHVNAVLVTGLLPFSRGAHVILGTPQGYRGEGVVKRFWEIVERHRINFFSGVPTLYCALLQVPVGKHRISSLEYGLCGAAPMPVEVLRSFQNQTGLKILEGYGLTEGTCVSCVNPPKGERRPGSIGLRVPGQHMKAVILDAQEKYLRDCLADETGVLVIRGPNVFSGYLKAEQNIGIWIDGAEGQRWLNTGDLGHQDADGYFWLTGRKKELIIRGGHNIDPASIEEPLHHHPAILLTAAVGRPDAHAGELPVAYVQLHAGASVTEEELMEFAKRNISERAAHPKYIRIVDQIPLTAVGKIFKPALRHREIVDVLSKTLSEAEIEFSSLIVRADSSRGICVQVTLGETAQEIVASRLLGQYPFLFEFTPAISFSD